MAEPHSPLTGWDEVQIEIDALIASSSDPFEPNTVANVHNLLAACRDLARLPAGVTKGYLSTFIIWWSNGMQMEVFSDRVEVYHFFDQRTDIWYEEHAPGQPFSPRLLAELAVVAKERP